MQRRPEYFVYRMNSGREENKVDTVSVILTNTPRWHASRTPSAARAAAGPWAAPLPGASGGLTGRSCSSRQPEGTARSAAAVVSTRTAARRV